MGLSRTYILKSDKLNHFNGWTKNQYHIIRNTISRITCFILALSWSVLLTITNSCVVRLLNYSNVYMPKISY